MLQIIVVIVSLHFIHHTISLLVIGLSNYNVITRITFSMTTLRGTVGPTTLCSHVKLHRAYSHLDCEIRAKLIEQS